MTTIHRTRNLLMYSASMFFTFCINVTAARAITVTYKVTNPTTTSDFGEIIANFLKWILSVAGIVALVMLIIGGMMYMTSSGDPQKASAAKKLVLITLGGLMLTLLSYAILVVLNDILTN